jgi:RNA polymerase sigma factor (sigma-70 family)
MAPASIEELAKPAGSFDPFRPRFVPVDTSLVDIRQTERLRVLIADDHPMVRQVIRRACEDRAALQIVGEAAFGVEAIEKCIDLQPDVLVLDLGLPDLDGIEVIKRLRDMNLSVRILVITGRDDRATVLSVLREGADGYLEKTGSVDRIGAAIEAVASGTRLFSLEHRQVLQEEIGDIARRMREMASASANLSRRERQVLGLIGEGLTTRQMARRLGVSERTIESHISRLYQKLGVRTRVQALHRAAGLGLIEL